MNLLFDIGGSKMRLGISDGFVFKESRIVPTPSSYQEGMDTFRSLALELTHGAQVEAVAGGIAGPFSDETASLVGSPNLSDWIGKPLKSDLEASFSAPVYIENDSAMVGLGEAVFGAGRGYGIVAYVTVSTGVGGVRIVDGRIDRKSIGFEPGHQIVDIDKTMVPGEQYGTLQELVSGRSIEARMGKKPEDISDPEFWDLTAKCLAYGLNNVIVHWSPDIVILGGGLVNGPSKSLPFERVEYHLGNILGIFPQLPPLKLGELADVGGLWGGVAYLTLLGQQR